MKPNLAVFLSFCGEEQQRAAHTAGLVAVHATGDKNIRLPGVPIARFHAKEGISGGILRQGAVLNDVESVPQGFEMRDDVIGVGPARLADVLQPRCALGVAPRRRGLSDWVEVVLIAHGKAGGIAWSDVICSVDVEAKSLIRSACEICG
jgi:hypothetical protein